MNDFKYQEFKKLDRDIQRPLVKRYLELTKHKKFDEDDFKSWLGRHIFIDDRPEDVTSSKVFSLSEVLRMSDDEATKWSVLKYKQDYIRYHEQVFNKKRNDTFRTGETYGKMMEIYMKEKGISNFSEVYDAGFLNWTDQWGMEWMNQQYGEEGADGRKVQMYRVIEKYVEENGWDFEEKKTETKIDYSNFKEWARRNSIPLPKQLKNYMEHKIAEGTKKHKKRKG